MLTAAACVSQPSCYEVEPFAPEIITNKISGDIREQSNMHSVMKQEYHCLPQHTQHIHTHIHKYVCGCAEMCVLNAMRVQRYADTQRCRALI